MFMRQVLYKSTRNSELRVTASQAILQGLAPDGGLFVPEELPKWDGDIDVLPQQTYKQTAFQVMRLLLTDYTEEELKSCIDKAYDSKFDDPMLAPLKKKGDAWYLELFHGPTIAFKDMALSILPHLMTTAAKKNHIDEDIVILTATSGDTGKAAMAGFADVEGTKIIVFYPKDGVSHVQELQMRTQRGGNVHVVGIAGNFDQAQTGVKNIFQDKEMGERMKKNHMRFSSANSINIGRLVPQVVYYFYAYGQMAAQGAIQPGDVINVCVPTGNFGNILAAYYAKQMGLPIKTLICASNENKVLVDFFRTGAYDKNRTFKLTSSPSMDILVSSNLERLIYKIAGDDSELTSKFMNQLSSEGVYRISEEMYDRLADFYGNYADEAQTAEEIAQVQRETGYVIDTHTAVASKVYRGYAIESGDRTPTVIASTASPYKFANVVVPAIYPSLADKSDLEMIDILSKISGVPVPQAIEDIRSAKILHDTFIESSDMEKEVAGWLQLK